MRKRVFPFGTDAINRYGISVTARAYAHAQWSSWADGIPQLIGHDHQRLLGWTWPYALVFEPGLSWSLGESIVPETESDKADLKAQFYHSLDRHVHEHCAPHEDALHSRMPEAGEEASLFYARAACLLREGLLEDVRPDLFDSEDKDGLVVVNGWTHLGGGAFDIDGLAVFAHPYFRRSFSRYNTLNGAFFETMDLLIAQGVEVRLALDRDLVGLAETYVPYAEFQYWWGPPFSDDLATIPAGVTRHASLPRHKLFSQVDHTDFFWSSRDGEHTLEIEEVRDAPSGAVGDRYGCRYVHSIVDEATGDVLHLDGAVRIYDDEGMVERLDVNLDAAPKQTEYTKLWRTDHPIPVPLWKRVVNDYYRDNYLVGEYFGADTTELDALEAADAAASTEPSVPEIDAALSASGEQDLVSLLVPYAMQPGDGVRVRLAMRERRSEPMEGRCFRPFQFLPDREDPERLHSLMEIETLHLRKLIEQSGGDVMLPPSPLWIQYRDDYINLAPVAHAEATLAADTLSAIRQYAAHYGSDPHRTVIGFTVAYPAGDREIILSAVGSASDLSDWFDAIGTAVPQTQDEYVAWADDVATYQRGRVGGGNDVFVLDTPSGLFIERIEVAPSFGARTWYDEEEGRLRWSITLGAEEDPLAGSELLRSALEEGVISVATSWLVGRVRCAGCESDYETCGCTVLDDGLALEVEPLHLYAHSWTDA